jgi:UMF1 family MFS transporter
MQTKRNIFLWTLYDFANSLVSIVFFLYFSQWIVVDRGMPDLYFNLTIAISAFLLLLTVPFTGVLLDRHFRRLTGLRITTALTALFYIFCAVSAVYNFDQPALILFTLGLYFYLLTFTFYTPLLNDISNPKNVGRVSGYGIAANYLGQVTGLILVLPFSNGSLSLFHSSARAETLIPATIAFTLLALPMLFFFKEPKKDKIFFDLKIELKGLLTETKKLFSYQGVALFMLAYFLFNDAILTASNNFPIFLQQVWGVSDTIKTYILLGILITSAIGGLISGAVADRYGHKRTLVFIITGWVFILPFVGLVTNFTLFIIATTVMGFWFGSNWAVSRSVMSYLAPPRGHNLAFAYFGLVERASSFVGPIVWGVVVGNLTSLGSDRYRYATLAVSVFILLGLIVLLRVKGDRKERFEMSQ